MAKSFWWFPDLPIGKTRKFLRNASCTPLEVNRFALNPAVLLGLAQLDGPHFHGGRIVLTLFPAMLSSDVPTTLSMRLRIEAAIGRLGSFPNF